MLPGIAIPKVGIGGNDPNTLLLVHCMGPNAGTSFADASPSANPITVNAVTTSTGQHKFGDSSALFNGSSSNLRLTTGSWSFTGDFTIEAWIFPTTIGINQTVADDTGATNSAWFFGLPSTNVLRFNSGAVNIANSVGTIAANTWTHVAVVRSGSTVKLYINGVNDGSGTLSGTLVSSGVFPFIGSRNGAGTPDQFFAGNMQEVRISSVARWTSNFIPPNRPYS
jgi:hypothetical protein